MKLSPNFTDATDGALPDDIEPELKDALLSERPEVARSSYTPGDRVGCPACGKTVSVTGKGELRAHKCDPVNGPGASIVKAARSGSKRTVKRDAPPNVRKWGVIGGAYATEYGAESYVAAVTGADRREIPEDVTKLPDPDAMVGPLVDVLWPTIPASVQKYIEQLVNHDALIECGMHWWFYFKGLQAFGREYALQHPNQPVRNGAQANVAVSASSHAVKGNPGAHSTSLAGAVPNGITFGRDR